jgi:hypothetical protein
LIESPNEQAGNLFREDITCLPCKPCIICYAIRARNSR